LSKLLQLEVRYIGQSDFSDPKYFRLDAHEKIQALQNEIIENQPNLEVFIKLLHFEHKDVCLFNPNDSNSLDNKDNFKDEITKQIPFKIWMSAIEGALIHHYQSDSLNKHYINKFPDKSHTYFPFFENKRIEFLYILLDEEYRAYVTCSKKAPASKKTIIEYQFKY
jgi:hypothetical protein